MDAEAVGFGKGSQLAHARPGASALASAAAALAAATAVLAAAAAALAAMLAAMLAVAAALAALRMPRLFSLLLVARHLRSYHLRQVSVLGDQQHRGHSRHCQASVSPHYLGVFAQH